jgi:hypothetical protein
MLIRVGGANATADRTPGPAHRVRNPQGNRATGIDAERRGDVTAVLTPDLLPADALTALDRCDRCGAQAYLRVILASGGELLFCAHHGKKYEEGLRSVAAEIHDETAKLVVTTAAPATDER